MPHKVKREAVEKGLKKSISDITHRQLKYNIFHIPSGAIYGLQIADYCSWAIYRKYGDWGDTELRPYMMMQGKIRSEFNIFRSGTTRYY
jgi:hypothetical protein